MPAETYIASRADFQPCACVECTRYSKTEAKLTRGEITVLYELLKSGELSNVDSVKSHGARDTRNGILDEDTSV